MSRKRSNNGKSQRELDQGFYHGLNAEEKAWLKNFNKQWQTGKVPEGQESLLTEDQLKDRRRADYLARYQYRNRHLIQYQQPDSPQDTLIGAYDLIHSDKPKTVIRRDFVNKKPKKKSPNE